MIHVHAPQPSKKKVIRGYCPTCDKESRFLSFYTEWYGFNKTCLRCGERWDDDGMANRPFAPAWRQRNIENAKATWRRL